MRRKAFAPWRSGVPGTSKAVEVELAKLGVWFFTDRLSATDAAAAAQRIEELGYGALWIPETMGRNPFAHAAWLLANTDRLVVATGIANIYHREPGVTVQAQKTLAEQSGNRFLLGLGVSHKPLVEGLRGLTYGKPVATMRTYLEKMAVSPYTSIEPDGAPPTVIAALGPNMLELARDATDGAHPYFTSPAHTRMAREILGPDKWLCVEQKVLMETDPDKARALARATAVRIKHCPTTATTGSAWGSRKKISRGTAPTPSSIPRSPGAMPRRYAGSSRALRSRRKPRLYSTREPGGPVRRSGLGDLEAFAP